MDVNIDRTENLGDGRVQVFFRTPGGTHTYVTVGHDKLADGRVYDVMAYQAGLVDGLSDGLARHESSGGLRQ
jgi:hypothetical protein